MYAPLRPDGCGKGLCMRLSYRLNLSLIAGIVVTSLAFTLYQTAGETHGIRADAEHHAMILAESMEGPAAAMLERDATAELVKLVDRYATPSGRTSVAVFDPGAELLAVTSSFSPPLPATLQPVQEALESGGPRSDFLTLGGRSIHMLAIPL